MIQMIKCVFFQKERENISLVQANESFKNFLLVMDERFTDGVKVNKLTDWLD